MAQAVENREAAAQASLRRLPLHITRPTTVPPGDQQPQGSFPQGVPHLPTRVALSS